MNNKIETIQPEQNTFEKVIDKLIDPLIMDSIDSALTSGHEFLSNVLLYCKRYNISISGISQLRENIPSKHSISTFAPEIKLKVYLTIILFNEGVDAAKNYLLAYWKDMEPQCNAFPNHRQHIENVIAESATYLIEIANNAGGFIRMEDILNEIPIPQDSIHIKYVDVLLKRKYPKDVIEVAMYIYTQEGDGSAHKYIEDLSNEIVEYAKKIQTTLSKDPLTVLISALNEKIRNSIVVTQKNKFGFLENIIYSDNISQLTTNRSQFEDNLWAAFLNGPHEEFVAAFRIILANIVFPTQIESGNTPLSKVATNLTAMAENFATIEDDKEILYHQCIDMIMHPQLFFYEKAKNSPSTFNPLSDFNTDLISTLEKQIFARHTYKFKLMLLALNNNSFNYMNILRQKIGNKHSESSVLDILLKNYDRDTKILNLTPKVLSEIETVFINAEKNLILRVARHLSTDTEYNAGEVAKFLVNLVPRHIFSNDNLEAIVKFVNSESEGYFGDRLRNEIVKFAIKNPKRKCSIFILENVEIDVKVMKDLFEEAFQELYI